MLETHKNKYVCFGFLHPLGGQSWLQVASWATRGRLAVETMCFCVFLRPTFLKSAFFGVFPRSKSHPKPSRPAEGAKSHGQVAVSKHKSKSKQVAPKHPKGPRRDQKGTPKDGPSAQQIVFLCFFRKHQPQKHRRCVLFITLGSTWAAQGVRFKP